MFFLTGDILLFNQIEMAVNTEFSNNPVCIIYSNFIFKKKNHHLASGSWSIFKQVQISIIHKIVIYRKITLKICNYHCDIEKHFKSFSFFFLCFQSQDNKTLYKFWPKSYKTASWSRGQDPIGRCVAQKDCIP